jgi:peptidyl-prolyl cis-trans isomerase B (cyclophilin B)
MAAIQLSAPQKGDTLAVMHTNMGDIKIKLFPEKAPKTVENFVTHSKNGYYNGLKFHRVINDFMIQGGDPRGNGTGGESIWGGSFSDEFDPELHNLRGALSMANSGPDTNGSQFFIVQAREVPSNMLEQMRDLEDNGFPADITAAYEALGGTPWLDFRHTVFGQVTEGMDVVDAIAAVETVNDVPRSDVIIESIEVTEL